MTLERRVQKDMIEAMKSKDKDKLRGLRAIKSAIQLAKTDGSGSELDEKAEIALLQKLIKQRQDSLSIYKEQGRDDLAAVEEAEIQTIKEYLPEQLSEDEISAAVDKIINDINAEGMKDMGKVMGIASSELLGKVDGKSLAAIVKAKLLQ